MGIFDTISTVESKFEEIRTAFNQYVVSPVNAFGLGGFVFDVEGESTIQLTNEATDHYTENNTAVQDHITVAPKIITLKNYVGELVDRQDPTTNTTLQNVVRKLTVIDSYLPKLSQGLSQAKSLLDGSQSDLTFNQAINNAADIYSIVKNLNPPIPRQQQAYLFFKALRDRKILVSVQTPFEYASSMAIISVLATQSADSAFVSDFTITLKQIETVSTKNVAFDFITDKFGRNGQQQSEIVNGGSIQGAQENISVLKRIIKKI